MSKEVLAKNLRAVIALSIILFIAEVIIAMVSGSSVILADGIHLYSNIFLILLAWTAYRLSSKQQPDRLSLCLWRRDLILLTVNAVILLLLVLAIIFQATKNLLFPQPVDSGVVIIFSVFALVINWFLLGLFRTHQHRDLKKIGYHLTGNLISSFVVFFSALLVYSLDNPLFDVIGTYLIAIIILTNTLRLWKRTASMILHKDLSGIDTATIKRHILKTKKVEGIQRFDAWRVYDDEIVINATLVIKKKEKHHITSIIDEVKHHLDKQGIGFAGFRVVY